MPFYEFECLKCKSKFDVKQQMSDEHIADCPECKSSNTRRVYTVPGLVVRSSAYMMAKNDAPKSRLENMEKVREERASRKKNAKTEREAQDNSLHVPKKK